MKLSLQAKKVVSVCLFFPLSIKVFFFNVGTPKNDKLKKQRAKVDLAPFNTLMNTCTVYFNTLLSYNLPTYNRRQILKDQFMKFKRIYY